MQGRPIVETEGLDEALEAMAYMQEQKHHRGHVDQRNKELLEAENHHRKNIGTAQGIHRQMAGGNLGVSQVHGEVQNVINNKSQKHQTADDHGFRSKIGPDQSLDGVISGSRSPVL